MSDKEVRIVVHSSGMPAAFFNLNVSEEVTRIDVSLSPLKGTDVVVASVLLMAARAITIEPDFENACSFALDVLTEFAIKRDGPSDIK